MHKKVRRNNENIQKKSKLLNRQRPKGKLRTFHGLDQNFALTVFALSMQCNTFPSTVFQTAEVQLTNPNPCIMQKKSRFTDFK